MALVMLIPACMIPVSSHTSRISVIVAFCGIPLMLGTIGINGDPISVVIRNFRNWRKKQGVMLYNKETVPLKSAPLTAAMSERRASDAIIEMVENYRDSRREKMAAQVFVEGVTFQFAKDPELAPLYADQVSDGGEEEQDEYLDDYFEDVDFSVNAEWTSDDEPAQPGQELSIDVSDEEDGDFW